MTVNPRVRAEPDRVDVSDTRLLSMMCPDLRSMGQSGGYHCLCRTGNKQKKQWRGHKAQENPADKAILRIHSHGFGFVHGDFSGFAMRQDVYILTNTIVIYSITVNEMNGK